MSLILAVRIVLLVLCLYAVECRQYRAFGVGIGLEGRDQHRGDVKPSLRVKIADVVNRLLWPAFGSVQQLADCLDVSTKSGANEQFTDYLSIVPFRGVGKRLPHQVPHGFGDQQGLGSRRAAGWVSGPAALEGVGMARIERAVRPADPTTVTTDVDGFISGSRPRLGGLTDARSVGQRLVVGARVLRLILAVFICHIKFSFG